MAKHGEFSHIEFPANDLERAKSFYGAVFGWEFRDMEGFDNYALYTAGPADVGGGIGLRGQTAGDVVRNYIAVDDVDAAVAKATANGGTLVTAKTDIGVGWYAAVKDPEGNEIGLYLSKREG
jgi:uncharacterized protein